MSIYQAPESAFETSVQRSRRAAIRGTICHLLMEAQLSGSLPPDFPVNPKLLPNTHLIFELPPHLLEDELVDFICVLVKDYPVFPHFRHEKE